MAEKEWSAKQEKKKGNEQKTMINMLVVNSTI